MKPIAFYQNITGEKGEHANRVGSAYWGEGKWNNYIKPLLPKENRNDMTLVDIGANNGLFCKLARDAGFRNVVGIEKDIGAVQRGITYQEGSGTNYKLLHREVGSTFSFDEMPIADVYLLSNVHYYFQLNDWLKFLDRLITRTVYCLIITRPLYRNKDHWRPKVGIADTKYYFRDWENVSAKYKTRNRHMEKKGDPSPRDLWALMFKSRLNRKRFDDLHPGATADTVKIPRDELVRDIAENENIKLEDTSYFKAWKARMSAHWSDKRIYDFVKSKVDLMYDIKENGVKDPILIQQDNKVIDGGHRIAILREMGQESIITRTI